MNQESYIFMIRLSFEQGKERVVHKVPRGVYSRGSHSFQEPRYTVFDAGYKNIPICVLPLNSEEQSYILYTTILYIIFASQNKQI